MASSALKLTEVALNKAVQLDFHAAEKLKALEGKVLGISISGLSIKFFFVFSENYIYLQSACLGEPDLFISAPPLTLLALLNATHPQTILQNEKVEVQGNVMLAQEIKLCFQKIDIDWEYYFSLLTGEIIAKQASTFVKNKLKKLKNLSKDLKSNVGEYLQEEIRVTPHYHMLEIFCDEVDELRMKTDLLEAKILQIKREVK